MKQNDIQQLDAQIRSRISELTALLEDENASKICSQTDKDSNTEPGTDLDRQITEKEKRELARLRSNLKWLTSDGGGCCEKCGCEIPVARLKVVPVTRLCIDCAS